MAKEQGASEEKSTHLGFTHSGWSEATVGRSGPWLSKYVGCSIFSPSESSVPLRKKTVDFLLPGAHKHYER